MKRPTLSDARWWSQGSNPRPWLLAHPCGSVSRSIVRGGCGGLLSAGPCLQVPLWSACPPGSTATCTSPCWSPALCTVPSPTGYSCGGKEPGWARRDTYSEWLMASPVLRHRAPGALMPCRERAAGAGAWAQSHCPLGQPSLGTSLCGRGWGRVVPEAPTTAGPSPREGAMELPELPEHSTHAGPCSMGSGQERPSETLPFMDGSPGLSEGEGRAESHSMSWNLHVLGCLPLLTQPAPWARFRGMGPRRAG